MRPPLSLKVSLPVLAGLLVLLGAACQDEPERHLGAKVGFGDGSVSSYTVLDADGNPSIIGAIFDAEGLQSPPDRPSDELLCNDRNEDGTIDRPAECLMTHAFVIPLPDKIARRDDVPFKWILLNWNAMGHIPPGVYDSPHFDVHFMIEPIESIFSILPGNCGPEFVQCDQFEVARKPLPANYIPADFKDVEAVVPAMGNHLVDVTGSEFTGVPFTRSWIYGSYDGRVTFYEEMLTMAYLTSKPNVCNPIKRPQAVGLSGYYPTQSCIQYDEATDSYTVSMEDFQYREAEPAAVIQS
ncbi:MAG: hypothetical protein KJO98_10040 [Rhodothermia bacterium]|nr:hypothetical protein [Rhodothermia bacterium]